MNIDWLPIIMFVAGVISTVFGLNLLFKGGFVEKLRKGLWKSGNDGMYGYDKYVRGMNYLISGLILLGFLIYILLM